MPSAPCLGLVCLLGSFSPGCGDGGGALQPDAGADAGSQDGGGGMDAGGGGMDAGGGVSCEGTSFIAVSAGASMACAIRGDGIMECWGHRIPNHAALDLEVNLAAGAPTPEPSGAGWTDVTVGGYACGVREDQTAHCISPLHGANDWMPFGDEARWARIFPRSLAIDQVCALSTDGEIYCLSESRLFEQESFDPDEQPQPIGEPGPWRDVFAGNRAFCAVKEDGSLWCKGTHLFAEDHTADDVLTRFDTEPDWRSAVVTPFLGCGIRRGGELWCWGPSSQDLWLSRLGTEADWESVATTGVGEVCALRADGSLWCWGRVRRPAELGEDRRVAGVWSAVSPGNDFTCALDGAGKAACWGYNHLGRLGIGSTGFVLEPREVADAEVREAAAGANHLCAVDTGDRVLCTGGTNEGESGRTQPTQELTALPGADWEHVAAGGFHSCGTTASGTLLCWGSNWNGQSGQDPPGTNDPTPRLVGGDADWRHVSAGANFTCATKQDASLWCWGAGSSHQLGQGDTEDRSAPARVGDDSDWESVAAAGDLLVGAACALEADGALWCWGTFYRFPSGSISFPTPTRVGDSAWTAFAMGGQDRCGIRDDGTLWCAGPRYPNFALPDEDASFQRIGEETDWSSISVGEEHACGLRAGGELWCFGYYGTGALGQGASEPAVGANGRVEDPLRVGDAADWVAVTAGRFFTCGVRQGGQLWCWGSNERGQLGLGGVWFGDPQCVL